MDEELNDNEIIPADEPGQVPTPLEPLEDEQLWGEPAQDDEAPGDETTESDGPAEAAAAKTADVDTELEPADEADKSKREHRVPLEKHIKLRERAQRAERERDEALRQLAQRAERERDEALAKLRQVEEKAVGSEAAMAENPQYQTVTRAAINAKLISATDRQAILADANPAQKLYEISKSKLTGWLAEQGLGTGAEPEPQPEKPQGAETKPTPAEQPADEMDDDAIDRLIFGGKGKVR